MKKSYPLIISMIIQILTVPFSHTKATASASLKAIDLVYFQDFPWHSNKSGSEIPGCFVAPDILSTSGFGHLPVLRCRERIHLLRSDTIIQHWKRMQAQNGFIEMSLPEFGIVHVRAEITAISSYLPSASELYAKRSTTTDIVTGTFIRHATSVRKYRFKDKKTGHIMTVNVTDNHRFYTINKGAFIPIKAISPTDRLITATGNTVKLLCLENQLHDCGQADRLQQPTQVYNLEVRQRHTYFVNDTAILVHNACAQQPEKLYYDQDKTRVRYDGHINPTTNKAEDYGILYYYNRFKSYEGYWQNGKAHGYGTRYNTSEKRMYEGLFENGRYHGKGITYDTETGGKIYDGLFKKGQPSGSGTCYYPNGNKQYEGFFKESALHGMGYAYHENGSVLYGGMWKEGDRHGFGRLFHSNGFIWYEGIWKNGLMDGQGTLFDREGRVIKTGVFIPN